MFNADDANVAPILEAAKNARKAGADIVIASVHCCVEYVTQPTPTQKPIVQKIAESGLVDLYIGHHAHVPQPIVELDGGPGGKGMWVAYGLGNFLSNQDGSTVGVPETANGVMLRATFTVSPEDEVDVDVGWTAVTVDRMGGHVVYPISKNSGAVGKLSAATVKARWKLVAAAVGKVGSRDQGAWRAARGRGHAQHSHAVTPAMDAGWRDYAPNAAPEMSSGSSCSCGRGSMRLAA